MLPTRRLALPLILVLSLLELGLPTTSAASIASWSQLSPGGGPPGLYERCAVFDQANDRMIVFGGGEQESGETWALSFGGSPAWTLLAGGPPPTRGATAIVDPIRRRMLVYGGISQGHHTSDVWAFGLDTGVWTQLIPTGPAPNPRMLACSAYDPVRDRMVIFCGLGGGEFNDVWVLSLSGPLAWTPISPPGALPPGTYGAVGIYNPVTDELVLTGGSGLSAAAIYRLSLSNPSAGWIGATASGSTPTALYASGVYVAELNSLVWFGGYPVELTAHAHILPLGEGSFTWSALPPIGPVGRYLHSAVFDAVQGRMVILGGSTGGGGYLSDCWALALDLSAGAPTIVDLLPGLGVVGAEVRVRGFNLTGASAVDFAGTPAVIASATPLEVLTHVPEGAVTGPVHVTTPSGILTSPLPFMVGVAPIVSRAEPDSGEWGDTIVVKGSTLSDCNILAIGGVVQPNFTVLSDTSISLVISQDAKSGPISLSNPFGSTTSSVTFKVIPYSSAGRIVSVRDLPNDQGGRVMIKWRAGAYDRAGRCCVLKYRVWRRAPMAAMLANAARGTAPSVAGPDYWELLGEMPAIRLNGYAMAAATLQDSIAGSNPYTAFFIETIADAAGTTYLSPVDSGYSVDNLSPPSPPTFVARYSGDVVALHWLPSVAADFKEFRLYRGGTGAFVPSATNLILATPDTGFVDHPPGGAGDFYKLGAADVHGNVSRFAMVTPTGATGVLASLVSATWTGAAAELLWFGSALPGAAVRIERSEEWAPWQLVATADADAEGYVRYSDASLSAGRTYRFRLAFTDGDRVSFAGEASIQVPAGILAIRSVAPNPSRGDVLRLLLSLARPEPASVRVLDLAGRVVREASVPASLTGELTIALGGGVPLRPGVYVVELRQAGQRATSRFTLIR